MDENHGNNNIPREYRAHYFDSADTIIEMCEHPPQTVIHLTREHYHNLISQPKNIMKIGHGNREENQELFN